MTDIELVIKIPSEVYENIKSATADDNDISSLLLGIHEATPLPKGQGRLIERLLNAAKALENKPRFILHSDGKIEQIIEPCDVVLDKIKDEIFDIDDETVLNPDSFYERKVYVRRSKVIDIIDKYKTESEANNG